MPTITFIQANGTEHTVTFDPGKTLMQAAVDNLVPGIQADCGGYCNCATCHCFVEPPWEATLPAPEQPEQDMLTCAIDPQPNSRLSCQIVLTEAMSGLVVRLPVSQT
ncbi:2Fe-2S ferredoxin (plasmid) [Azospirillum sp. B510]|uniref:2Fe-2S iron-sulfur cluster-binding protein n=1 Tax=Azospirillum sp. (strain B510) TaxID=137722 RepID=UPI0001C4CB91|nr:2Fe-2S iron-sulfur cluster-binding protein [Azospirillum sp. B510]BAI74834.1 2Fe-2S ferredoxin [Azospirillum sp. B510]